MEDVRTVTLTHMLGEGIARSSALGHSLKSWRYMATSGVFAICSRCGAYAHIDFYPLPHLNEDSVTYWGMCLPDGQAR